MLPRFVFIVDHAAGQDNARWHVCRYEGKDVCRQLLASATQNLRFAKLLQQASYVGFVGGDSASKLGRRGRIGANEQKATLWRLVHKAKQVHPQAACS